MRTSVGNLVAGSRTLRGSAVLAIIAVVSVVWVVHHTVQRSQASTEWVVHTQEVLTAIENVLSTIVDADTAVRSGASSADARNLTALGQAARTVDTEVSHLAALTADNPNQRARLTQLRQDAAGVLAALGAMVEGTQAPRSVNPTDAEAQRRRMDGARRTLQAMRAEANRLLADRVQVDQAAARRLQFISMALAPAAPGILAWIFWLLARSARRQRQGADTLRQANENLEEQVDVSAAELRDSHARLQSIIDSAVDGIIVIDGHGQIEAFNPGAERLFGYLEPEVVGRNVKMLMPSPYHDEHDGYLDQYLHTGAAKIIGTGREVTGRRRDGSTFPLHLSVGEMSIKGERKFTGMLHDLTKRARLEDELRASEARWRSVIDSAVDGIVVIDAHGRIEAFNPAAVRLFGYEECEVVGRNVSMLMPSPYHEEHDTYLARHLATGVQKIIGTGREVTGLRRDGTTFPLHLSVGKITAGEEHRFTGILHDLSARVRIEKQLRDQTSLAKLGEMAAVIAHEVKNPLAGVRGAIQIIGTRLPKDSKDAQIVGEIVSRIDTLNELMKDLLLFARPPQPKVALVDMGTLVTTTANLLRGDPAFEHVAVRVDGEPARALGDAELLKIVFVNLLVNAAHAMQGRGTIHVSLASIADICQIVFADEGPGIPADALEKIFTPFFTTKARGSGLGLPTVRRLIEAHQGTISIACPPAGGTVVTIQLPGESLAVTM
jgi:two-component system sensor kinase FixL